jgi:hypothetical protein
MPYQMMQPRFPVGMTYATPGALALIVDLSKYLHRHHCGDWGEELCAEDKEANQHSLKDGTRLLSCYRTPRRRPSLHHHRARPEHDDDPAA